MRESGSGSVIRVLAALALAALVGVFALSGCGSDSGTTTNETTLSEKPGMSEPGEGKKAEEAEAAEAAKEAGKAEAPKGKPAAGAEEAETGTEGAAGGGESLEEGKTVFTTNCAGCHTLADAGTSGEVGPNLDQLMPDEATVEHQVINGGGPMPAFGPILEKGEIEAVAKYVSSVAGKG